MCLALFFKQTESEGSLGGGSRLADVDDTELFVFQIFCQFKEIVLTDIVARKHDCRVFLVVDEPGKRVAECFNHGTGTEIGTSDAGHYHHFALLAERVGYGLHFIKESRSDG